MPQALEKGFGGEGGGALGGGESGNAAPRATGEAGTKLPPRALGEVGMVVCG